jgi:hypothetical protein
LDLLPLGDQYFHALFFLAQMGTTSFYAKVWHKDSVQLEIALKIKSKDPFTENRCVSGVFK